MINTQTGIVTHLSMKVDSQEIFHCEINLQVIKNTCFLNSSSQYNQVHTRESISCQIPTGMYNVQFSCTECNYITAHVQLTQLDKKSHEM